MALEARVGFLAKGMPEANSPTLATVSSSSGVNCNPKMEETASTEGETDPRVGVSSTWEEEIPLVASEPLSLWEEVALVEGKGVSSTWEMVPLVEGKGVSSTWGPLTKSWSCPLAVGKNPQGART